MRAPTLLTLAHAALSAAFVVPQFMNEEVKDIDIKPELSFSRIVRIACTGCPVDVDSDILLDFNLPASSPDKLTLNGVPVLPVDASTASTQMIKAPLIPANTDTIQYFANMDNYKQAELDYSLLTTQQMIFTDGGYNLDTLELRIAGVNGIPVKIEGVSLEVREDLQDGTMIIGQVTPIPLSDMCNLNIACLFNKMIEKMKKPFKGMRKPGCGRKRPGAFHTGPAMPHPEHSHPHKKPHNAHKHKGFFKSVIGQVLLPVMIGILCGMAFGAIALLVTHAFVMLFRRFRARAAERRARCGGRRGCSRWRRRCQREEEAAGDDSEVAKGLLNEQPPAYVDEGLEVVAEKE